MWEHDENEAFMEEHDADIIEEGTDVEDDFADTAVLESDELAEADAFAEGAVSDFVGDSLVMFDVDDLVAEFEAEGMEDSSASSRLRRRLEAIAERKRRHDDLADFADYNLDA